MHYPLSSVHKLIYEAIHPDALSDAPKSPSSDIWHCLIREIEESRLSILSQLNQATGTDALKVIVYTCQAGYISLINRVGTYLLPHDAEEANQGNDTVNQTHYRKVRRLLIRHLNELYRHFYPYFDSEQTVPKFLLCSRQGTINSKLALLRKRLTQLAVDTQLINIICLPLEQVTTASPPIFTYRQMHYLLLILSELEAFCCSADTTPGLSTLPRFLIEMNFNEPQFIAYFISRLQEQVTGEMSLYEQAEKWAFHLKEFRQLSSSTQYALYPLRQPVKELLINVAEQELQFVHQKMLLLSRTAGTSLPDPKESASIITSFTVSQLGVFIRLLVDCQLIQYHNQTELLKLIAGCVKTTKTNQISAESLRVRYYNPDKASINITKEYLLQMIKRLQTY